MNTKNFRKNELQFEYFSENFHRFEEEFYQYSALDIPLTFISDDILLSMDRSQKSFFKLNRSNAVDARDHYFIFKIKTSPDSNLVRIYEYKGHTVHFIEEVARK